VGTTVVRQKRRIPLEEVSAVCVRRGVVGHELLAVGDEAFKVVVAELGDTGIGKGVPRKLEHFFPVEARSAREGSEWEGLAADREGRVFVMKESSGTVFVFSPDFEKLLQTIELDASESDEPRVRSLFEDPDAGAEALVLLPPSDLLVAKQRDPIMFVQFGPPDTRVSAGGRMSLAQDIAFQLSENAHAKLTALRHWTMRADEESEMKSVNDMAIDASGRLHVISSKSRRIYRLDIGDHEVRIDDDWDLADAIEMSKDRKPEGLAFDPDGRFVVAVDTKDERDNVFLLAKLEDN